MVGPGGWGAGGIPRVSARRPACQNPPVAQSTRPPTPVSAPLRFRVVSAAGNRFAVLDATARSFADPARIARMLCGDRHRGASFDGVLFVQRPTADGDCRMLLHNADGSRAEACGNGLRCVALFARSTGIVAGSPVRVETDCGTRTVELLSAPGPRTTARASMGRGTVLERDVEFRLTDRVVRATLVDVGNPHCVVEVADLAETPVAELGSQLETHRRFPAGTNVEFVARDGASLQLRVWERGVGETGACGTGACAAALAVSDDVAFELEVASPGGVLTVQRDPAGELWLSGPCEALQWVEYLEP